MRKILLVSQGIKLMLFCRQTNPLPFNRGFLLNVGFIEAIALDDYHCFFFHDVDLLPENDRNIYSCSTFPRLLAVARSNSNYT